MSGIEVDKKSIASPKYDRFNPHPEYANLMRSKTNSKNSAKYVENYDKIDWSRNLDEPKPEPVKLTDDELLRDEIYECCDQLGELGVPYLIVKPIRDYAQLLVKDPDQQELDL